MDSPAPVPLQPGQLVYRRGRPKAIGIVIGVILTPLELALVRWSASDSTIEPVEVLEAVLKLFG
jgi:hypothetical protein